MSDHLVSLLEGAKRPRILVLGDVMLDRYVWGDVERISPEGPVPVLRVDKEEHRLGGAGNVASMLAALEARPVLATVVGDDAEGRIVRDLLRGIDVDCGCVMSCSDRRTTVKERLLGRSHEHDPHQMMRVDRENDGPITGELAERLLAEVRECMGEFDFVVVSDYNKGVCAGDILPRLIETARTAGVRVVVDPVRGRDFGCYAGAACVTPNRWEASVAAGMKISTPNDGLVAARKILQFGVETVLVTLDRDGIAWADTSGNARVFACQPREVADIAGAGDMVVSAVAYCLAAGADYASAVEVANLAGGLEVERVGVVPVSRAELLGEFSQAACPAGRKVLPLDQLRTELDGQRRAGKRIVMTNGCFDLLHPGHVVLLEKARQEGDCLVVGVNSDRSVRALKGEGRPIVNQQGRAQMLAALACVDYVVVFDETSVAGLVEQVLPDVLVKSAEYAVEQVVGHEIVERSGGRVTLVPMESDYSTTGLLERLGSVQRGGDDG